MILVPEVWFKDLLRLAKNAEADREKYEWGKSEINDATQTNASSLIGYAKSADAILKFNERVFR